MMGAIFALAIGFLPASGIARELDADGGREAELERRLAGPDGAVMVVAHRTCWREASENSLDAIEACIAAGIDMVEIDVRATRDGQLVLMHDATVDRMTDGTGRVEDMDWADLAKLRLREGQGRGSALTDRRIPRFEDALRVAKGRILINVDAKIAVTEEVLGLIDRAGDRDQVLFKAEAPLEDIRRLAPWVSQVRFQPILREPTLAGDAAGIVATYDPIHPVSYEIDVKGRAFTPTLTPIIQARCARYWVNSLAGRAYDDEDAQADPDGVWGELIAHGVDAIQTDYPIQLKSYLAHTGATSFRCTPAAP
ncbi:glycerophosphodiester phosphodiesterase family protein [Erythrobacter sp. SG61-1L]|uniref:glycerophosphodiester phosphodiesterase family protein n=1 Tax=Erythrobacter sp. SG61-1L TaxID=1603897 RepID=UPI0006C92C5E|nr:glycerophosphodiester phosphodiesterase family protein [Erythrobacter sp. SG61-1L]